MLLILLGAPSVFAGGLSCEIVKQLTPDQIEAARDSDAITVLQDLSTLAESAKPGEVVRVGVPGDNLALIGGTINPENGQCKGDEKQVRVCQNVQAMKAQYKAEIRVIPSPVWCADTVAK